MVLIIANILSLIGNTLFTISSILKNKRKILLLQCSNYVVAVIAEYLTGAYSGMVQEATSFFRNIVLLFVKTKNKIVKVMITLIFVAIAVVLGILFNIWFSDGVWYGYLPVMGTIVYSTATILAFTINCNEIKSELIIKIGLIINSCLWLTYGYFVMLYPIMIFNVLTIVLCIISLVRIMVVSKRLSNNNLEVENTNLENEKN